MTKKGHKQSKEHVRKRMLSSKKYYETHERSKPMLGKKHSEATKKKIGISHIGRYDGVLNPFYGKKHSEATKKKIGEYSKKRVITKKTRLKLSFINSGVKNGFYGKKHSEATKKKIGDMEKGNKYALGLKRTELTKEKIRKSRLLQVFPFKDTKPEKMMQLALQLENIPFVKHKAILGQPDIFIEPNVCLFVDGCYWHNCPLCHTSKKIKCIYEPTLLRDVIINHQLSLDGYIVIRIWEHDIVNADSRIKRNVIDTIKQLMLRII